jgi:hypothetical protein
VSEPLDQGSWKRSDVTKHVVALRSAVTRYEGARSPSRLDEAFAAAAAAVATVRGARADEPPEVDEVRELFDQLPDFERLVSLAAGQAERSAAAAGARIWQWFAFASAPPHWNEAERWRARLLVALACAPLDGRGGTWLGPRLLKLAANRWAALILDELSGADEQVWQRILGERYEPVRQLCAPRTTWRTRGISALLSTDAKTLATLSARLERWMSAGGDLERLPGELEASLVHSRIPTRLA